MNLGYKQTEVGEIPEEWGIAAFDTLGSIVDGDIRLNTELVKKPTRRSLEVCARTPAVIGLLCASTSLQRTLCAAGLAEGVRLGSNGLGICSNNLARASATGIQLPR